MFVNIKCPQRDLPFVFQAAAVVAVMLLLGLCMLAQCAAEMVLLDSQIDRVRMDLKRLDGAVAMYFGRHGQYPGTLEVLQSQEPFDGTGALLPEGAHLDPWKQPYIIEPRNLHPQTGKPLIYSNGPPEAPRRISNWD